MRRCGRYSVCLVAVLLAATATGLAAHRTPAISRLDPDTVTVDEGPAVHDTTPDVDWIKIDGAGFRRSSSVRLDGDRVPSKYVSPSRIDVSYADILDHIVKEGYGNRTVAVQVVDRRRRMLRSNSVQFHFWFNGIGG